MTASEQGLVALFIPDMPPPTRAMQRCGICFEGFEDSQLAHVLCSAHPICRTCLSSWAEQTLLLGKTDIARCVVHGCGKQLLTIDHQDLAQLLDERLMVMLQENIAQQLGIAGGKGRPLSCAHCKARRSFALKPVAVGSVPVELVCTHCQHLLCLICHEQIQRNGNNSSSSTGTSKHKLSWSCSSNTARAIPGETSHTCKDACMNEIRLHVKNASNNIKPCPSCFVLSHRYAGCPHMSCEGTYGCQKKWCWECLDKVHHTEAECRQRQILMQSPARRGNAMPLHDWANRSLHVGKAASLQAGRGTILLLLLPCLAWKKYQTSLEERRLAVMEQLVHGGMDVFIESESFVERFANETLDQGRWVGACFLSYRALDGGVVVRVHSHAQNRANGSRCELEVGGSMNVHISPDRVQSKNSAEELVARCCKRAIRHHHRQ